MNYRVTAAVLCLLFTFPVLLNAQSPTGWVESFDDGNLSRWSIDGNSTYKITSDNKTLKIDYSRTASSNIWDNFNYTSPKTIDIRNKPVISINVKSNVNTILSIKPVGSGDVPLIARSISGDGNWHTIKFDVVTSGSEIFSKIYMYFDGSSSSQKNGTIWFDDFRMGDSVGVNTPADWSAGDKAILATQLLLSSTVEGNSEGEYKSGAKAKLTNVLSSVQNLKTGNITDQKVVDKAVWDLYDACVTYESSVNAIQSGLNDPTPTKETRYLYAHLFDLSNKALLYGMHDATGYGVGWSGDDNRSDIKDVCGDYPAVFNEDMNRVETDNEVDRMIYRLTTAYNMGAVISMVWHQLDYTGTHFYPQYLTDPYVVEKYVPGGIYHQDYKNKLHKVASFLKSFRGAKGESIPVIFRPYHEHLQSPFWWGVAYCTAQQYNQLWQFTVDYLRDSLNVHNLIYIQSPMLNDINSGDSYVSKRYPGDNYVDIFGVDDYEVFLKSSDLFTSSLQVLVKQASSKNKPAAIAEIGQEGITTPGLFYDKILSPIKNDSLASAVVYASTWRNESTSHFFSPYPGHSSVPDFLKFYNDPYTLFLADLPKMYKRSEDRTAPEFISRFDSVVVSPTVQAKIEINTDKRAFLRYSNIDQPYSAMTGDFSSGQGGYNHSFIVSGKQGQIFRIYVKAMDLWGNESQGSFNVDILVDTTQLPVVWSDPRYIDKDWKLGLTPIGMESNGAVTKIDSIATAYFRKNLVLSSIPQSLGILVQSQGGAAVFINNKEVGRLNLPADKELTYNTLPTSSSAFNKVFVLDTLALKNLKAGDNTIAIEVHAGLNKPVASVNMQIFNEKQTFIPLGSEWKYFAAGSKPLDMKLKDITSVEFTKGMIPDKFALHPNYPNPFNPSTRIRYELAKDVTVNLSVYDILGRRIQNLVDREQKAGVYDVSFDASKLSSGTYIVMIKAGDFFQSMKVLYLK